MELEAGCVVSSIRRLRRYLFSVFFLIFTDYECLQQISKIGELKPRVQRWMECFSAYNYHISYRRGRDKANADFLSRFPLPPTAEDISGSSALTDPDDLGVYLIRACGYTTPSCPIPGVGLGGLTSSPYDNPGTGTNPFTAPVLGELPLTKYDFKTHRAPMPLLNTEESCLSYAIDDQRPTVLGPPEAERLSWQATPRSALITARPPAVGSPRPSLQCLPQRSRFARHRLRAWSA